MMTQLISSAWGAAIEEWTLFALHQDWSTTTVRTRLDHLRRDARRIGGDPFDVGPLDLVEWFNRQRWAVETRRGHKTTLRAFYSWAEQTGKVAVSPALALPKVRPAQPRPNPCSDDAYVEAIANAGVRERLMVRLGAEVGLRRGEISRVHSGDLVRDLDGWTLRVLGKGGRERYLPLPPLLAEELRSLPAGWAFPGNDEGHLSPRWVGTLVTRLIPGDWTTHSLRHRFATRTHQVERDLTQVQELLGHASIVTTRNYVWTDRSRLRQTVEAASGSEPVRRVA